MSKNEVPPPVLPGVLDMTIRDYFAAASMNGLVISGVRPGVNITAKLFAESAYELADAMLKARV